LHVGCGRRLLTGWINLDIEPFPGVDLVVDASRKLPFQELEAVYAEHFLEHLRVDAAVAFLARAQRALASGSWIRLSTPNLDWVVHMQYERTAWGEEKAMRGLLLNRAFHAWGHHFLWNREALELVLQAVGFEEVRFCGYGESVLEQFRGIEQHEAYPDAPEEPHVLIVEGRKGDRRRDVLERVLRTIREDYLSHFEPLPAQMIVADDLE
jgi:predicted SAM-dependent methyltransferase